jgi:hypothetical protein
MRHFLLVLLVCGAARAQLTVSLGMDSGLALKITTSSDRGPSASSRINGMVRVGHRSEPIHRVLRDSSGQPMFGYDIEIREQGFGLFQIVAAPLSEEFERTLGAAGKVATFDSRRHAGVSGLGDRALIELLVNPSTGERISDTLEIVKASSDMSVRMGAGSGSGSGSGAGSAGVGAGARAGASAGRGTASGSGAGSGSGVGIGIEPAGDMQLWSFIATKNGQRLVTMDSGASVTGNALMFYLPGQGGYFFVAAPTTLPGFLKVGMAYGNRLTFTWNNENYEVISTRQILTRTTVGEVWVYHDPKYRPRRISPLAGRPATDEIQWGACDDIKSWFSKNE